MGKLIVCERSGRWATALRRELGQAGLRVCESRSLAECWAMLAERPCSFVVVELTSSVTDELLERMARLTVEFPKVRVAVVADRSMTDYQWLMREAGAVHFTCSPRRLAPLAQTASRHLARVPVPQQSLTERIWSSLPWG